MISKKTQGGFGIRVLGWILTCLCLNFLMGKMKIIIIPWRCIWLFVTPWTAAHQTSLFLAISQSLLKLMMPSSHHILCCPLLFLPSIFPSIRVFSNVSPLRIGWPKYWSFSFSLSPSNEYSGLISFRIGWSPCSPRDSQESSPASQSKSISSSVFSLLYGPTLWYPYMTTGKAIALARQTLLAE